MSNIEGAIWGVVCAEDRKSNFEALRAQPRILSAYPIHSIHETGEYNLIII
jgi:hypothetical protein